MLARDFLSTDRVPPRDISVAAEYFVTYRENFEFLCCDDAQTAFIHLISVKEYFSVCELDSLNESSHHSLLKALISLFIFTESQDFIESLLQIFWYVSGFFRTRTSLELFAFADFYDKLFICISSSDPVFFDSAQAILSNLILCSKFQELKPVVYWLQLVPCLTSNTYRSAILRVISDLSIPQNLFVTVAEQALSCILSDDCACNIISESAETLTHIIWESYSFEIPYKEVRSLVEPHIESLFKLIPQWRLHSVYSLLECCMIREIGFKFICDPSQIEIIGILLREALDNENQDDITRGLMFVSKLVREAQWEIPSGFFTWCLQLAVNGTYQMKHAAVLLICEKVKVTEVPEEVGVEFFEIVLELVMVPAMDIIGELLNCVYDLLDSQWGFTAYLLREWEDFGLLWEKFNEIEEKLDGENQEALDRIDDLRRRITDELPRDYGTIYRNEDI
jgi:hypothetical protein